MICMKKYRVHRRRLAHNCPWVDYNHSRVGSENDWVMPWWLYRGIETLVVVVAVVVVVVVVKEHGGPLQTPVSIP